MALFKCSSCQQVYEDYYPPDDTCLKCNKASIRIITQTNHERRRTMEETLNMTSIFGDCEVISRYTRANAISDGVLVDITTNFPELCKMYKFPVACTASVWGIITRAVESKKHCNDIEGVIWDVLWMSQKGIVRRIDDTQHIFRVIITGTGTNRYHDMKIVCHGGDEGEPVLTIMLPEED
jgi:hypothetical protein